MNTWPIILLIVTIFSGVTPTKAGPRYSKPENPHRRLGCKLVAAIEKNHFKNALAMLNAEQANIDFTTTNKEEKTALILAIEKNNPKLVQSLVESGADLNYRGNFSLSPLSIAHKLNHLNLVTFLIEQYTTNLNNLEAQFCIDPVLLWACKNGQIPIIEKLIAQKDRLDLNLADQHKETALGICLNSASDEKIQPYAKIVALLIKAGAKLDKPTGSASKTPYELLQKSPILLETFKYLMPISFSPLPLTKEQFILEEILSLINNHFKKEGSLLSFQPKDSNDKVTHLILTILYFYIEHSTKKGEKVRDLLSVVFPHKEMSPTVAGFQKKLIKPLINLFSQVIREMYAFRSKEDYQQRINFLHFAQSCYGKNPTQKKLYSRFNDFSITFKNY